MDRTVKDRRVITPRPKLVEWGSGSLELGLDASASVGPGLPKSSVDAMKKTWRNFTYEQGSLKISEDKSLPQNTFSMGGRKPPELKMEYSVSVSADGAAASAKDGTGLLHAWHTFLQLIHPNNEGAELKNLRLPRAEISDGPDLGFRGIHLCVFPETSLAALEKLLKFCAFLKFSHVTVEFWGMLRLDAMKELAWPQAFTKEQVGPVFESARNMGLRLVPMLNHLGHASGARVGCGRHAVLNQNPRLAPLFEFDGWTWCVSNPATRELLAGARAELMDFFGGGKGCDYFFLGCDEAYSFASCDACAARDPGELLCEYLNYIDDDLRKHGARPVIWGDQLLDGKDFPGYIATGAETKGAIKNLSRNFVVADWQYDLKDGQDATFRFFKDQGFDVWPAPWHDGGNIVSLCASAKKLSLPGVMATTWHTLVQNPGMVWTAACEMWGGVHGGHSAMNSLAMKLCGTKIPYRDAGWGPKEVYYRYN